MAAAERCRSILDPTLCAALREAPGFADSTAVAGRHAAKTARSADSTDAHITASLLSGAADMVSLPEPQAKSSPDAAVHTPIAIEGNVSSRKKRKRGKASVAETPEGQPDRLRQETCLDSVMQHLEMAVSLLFSACQPPAQTCAPPQMLPGDQRPTLDELLAVHRDALSTDGGRPRRVLPHDVLVRLVRYLEASAAKIASSRGAGSLGSIGAAEVAIVQLDSSSKLAGPCPCTAPSLAWVVLLSIELCHISC